MGEETTTTTVKGERRLGERAGRASMILGILLLTFMGTPDNLFALSGGLITIIIAVCVIYLGYISRHGGYRTGGTVGIILGLFAFYRLFLEAYVLEFAGLLQVNDFSLVPYLLIVLTVLAFVYSYYRPKKTVTKTKKTK